MNFIDVRFEEYGRAMGNIERRVRREATRAMARRQVITEAITKQLSRVQASEILGISALHKRRLRRKVEGWECQR